MCERWYHAELSQACAEQLLIRDGRNGAFLVRPSESVHGAFAICLLYQQHVHTYRILPEENGLLSVQSVQGFEVKKFVGLSELVSAYSHEQNGLVTALQYPVEQDREDGTGQTHVEAGKSLCWKDHSCSVSRISSVQCTRRTPIQGDQEPPRKQDLVLHPELEKQCMKLDREIGITWLSLKILTQVFGHMSSPLQHEDEQVSVLDQLIHKVITVQEILSVLESKIVQMFQEYVTASPISPKIHSSVPPRLPVTGTNNWTSKREQTMYSDRNQSRSSCPNSLSMFIGTWNMGSSTSPRSISSWLSSKGMGRTLHDTGICVSHDLYMIGTQENPQGDREWAEFLRTSLISHTGRQYKVVSVHSLGSVKLVLLVKQEHESLISHVQTSSVRTGISNTLGNRGAVGISLDFSGTSMGFVTCHLVSGTERVQKRNQSFGEILRGLALGEETLRSFQLPLRLSHLFWAGDLNYRLNMPVQDVLQCVYSGGYHVLLPVDQLNQERERKKIFLGFKEEQITFPPTCRYEKGSRSYDLQKAKTTGTRLSAPSWSDRVLWTSYPDTDVKCTSYGCTDDIVTSDHSPVFATFEVGLNCQTLKDTNCTLRFQSIEAIIKTQSRSRGCIEFRSLCLRGSPQSNVNSAHSMEGSAFLKLGWSDLDLPEITLVGQDTRSAQNEYLLLNIRPTDGGEAYGECCVSVRALRNSTEEHFQAFLSQRGEETGSLRGRVKVCSFSEAKPERSPTNQQRESERVKESSSQITCADNSSCDPQDSPFSRNQVRRRPASLCCVTGSYSNAEYFLFEGIPSPRTPTSPRPHSALVSGEHLNTKHGARGELRAELEKTFSLQTNRPSRTISSYITALVVRIRFWSVDQPEGLEVQNMSGYKGNLHDDGLLPPTVPTLLTVIMKISFVSTHIYSFQVLHPVHRPESKSTARAGLNIHRQRIGGSRLGGRIRVENEESRSVNRRRIGQIPEQEV
ncbi:phosphatidylinositol 3,4,5-trisphosphate 5-phosphatase 2A-like [Rhinophrynus dorsalis]